MDCNHHLGIDLHIHSTASDGSFTPAEILEHAQRLDLAAIAITDHDSIDGSREAQQCGIPPSLNFLTGVEISAAHPPFFPGSGSFHILGYNINLANRELNQALSKLQDARKNRNPAILKLLNKLGFQISLEEVNQEAGEGQLGRPQPHLKATLGNGMFVDARIIGRDHHVIHPPMRQKLVQRPIDQRLAQKVAEILPNNPLRALPDPDMPDDHPDTPCPAAPTSSA